MTIQQETIDLFERVGFKVTLRNNDTHMIFDHESGKLQITHWPTTGTWMVWGRTWKRSTPEQVIEAFRVGRFQMPKDIVHRMNMCKRCRGAIYWATTTKGNYVPLNEDGSIHRGCLVTRAEDLRAPH